jgi:Membrane-associating domain
MIMFAAMAAVKDYDDLPQAENAVIIGSLGFIYVIAMLVSDFMRFQSKYFPNLDIWEFSFDLMFSFLTFFGAMALAIKCNKKVGGVATCKALFANKSSNLSHSRASAAFGFLASFAFVASTILSYTKLVNSRRK